MTIKSCKVRVFNADGDFVYETTNEKIEAPHGVTRMLHKASVRAVEIHYKDGRSAEFTLLKNEKPTGG